MAYAKNITSAKIVSHPTFDKDFAETVVYSDEEKKSEYKFAYKYANERNVLVFPSLNGCTLHNNANSLAKIIDSLSIGIFCHA